MTVVVALSVAIVCVIVALVRQRRWEARPIVILGAGPLTAKLVEEMDSSPVGCRLAGLVNPEAPEEEELGSVPWLGPSDRLGEILENVRPSRVIVSLAERRGRLPFEPLLRLRTRGIAVEDVLDFYERISGKVAIEALTPGALILAKGFRNDGAGQAAARAISLLLALVALIVTAPLLLMVALAVKLDSQGPVLFVQARAGRDGRPFRLLKFRTMHPPAEGEAASEWVQDNTARITRLGKWLRRFRIDELPQMVNVLRGEMNLIGPRPHPVTNQQVFLDNIAYYELRSTVRPGVTGWAQVRYGYANNLEEETEKMRYDLYYIKNRTLWLDIRILCETVLIMITGRGATEVRRFARRKEALKTRAALVTQAVER